MHRQMPGSESITAGWWPIRESKVRYGFSTSTSYRLVAEQLIEARKVGSRTLINDDSVRRYMAGLPRPEIKSDDRAVKLAERAA